jgi:protein-S-isoprenylcysteine O-methyltransferase Ste14
VHREAVVKKYAKQLLRALSYVAIVVLPVLLGWGVNDLGGYFRDPVRTGYVGLGVLGLLIVFIPGLNVHPFKKGSRVVGGKLARTMGVSTILLTLFLPYADRRGLLTFPDREAWRWAGLALCVLGAAIRGAGLWSLGRQFSSYVTLQENHQLVQTGLYKRVRHPMYLGLLMSVAGLPLVFRSWLVIPIWGLALLFVLLRMGQEERLLAEHFGSEFESYRRRTWRLLPYVY